MASITQLLIKGIRSFDPDNNAVIHFYKPLTIIVGPNGTGKTTIIEALKYATTGDMPPNTKGGAFIHDPRVLGRSEVTSEVRLRFSSVNDVPMESQRSAQVIQKKTTSTFKTLQSIIQYVDPETGEKTSTTIRANELDEEMARNLGVSKAILDNVIFCHQEESNWPLSDSSTLKKKFDEIFASTQYSKMCDDLKKLAKAEAITLKEHRMNLTIREKDRDTSRKLQMQNVELEELIKNYKVKTDHLTDKLAELTTNIKGLSEGAEEQQMAATRLAILDREFESYSADAERIHRQLTVIDASDEDLQQMLSETEAQINQERERRQQMEAQYKECDKELTETQDSLCNLLSQQGKFKADAENYERVRGERKKLIDEIRPKLLQGSSPGSDLFAEEVEESAEEFLHLLETQLKHDRGEMESTKEQSRAKQQDITESLQELRIQERQCQNVLKSSKAKKEECIRRLDESRRQIELISTDTVDLEALKENVQEKEGELEAFKSTIEAAAIDEQITLKDQELASAEDKFTSLSQAPDQNQTLESRVTLAVKTLDRKGKSSRLNKLVEDNRKHFERHLNHTPLPQSVAYQVQSTIGVKKEAIKTKTRQVKDVYMKLAGVEAKFSLLQAQVSKKQSQLIELQGKVQEACGSQDLPAALQQADSLLQLKESQLYRIKGMESIYSDLLDKSYHPRTTSHEVKRAKCDVEHSVPEKCPLCDSDFKKQWDAKQFLKDLAEKQEGLQESSRELTLELQRAKADIVLLRNASTAWDQLDRIRKIELPSLEDEQRQYAERAIELRRELGEKDSELQQTQLETVDLEKLIKPALEIGFLDAQLRHLDDEIRLLPRDKPSSDESSNETSRLAAQLKGQRAELQALRVRKEQDRSTLMDLEKQVRGCKNRLVEASSKDQTLFRLTQLVSSLEDEIAKAEKASEMTAARLSELTPAIAAKQEEMWLAIKVGDELVSQYQESITTLSRCQAQLVNMDRTILQFEKSNIHLKLNQANIAIQKHESDILLHRDTITEIREEMESLDAQINSNLTRKDNILRNIKYQKTCLKLKAVNEDRKQLQQLYEFNSNENLQVELATNREEQNNLIGKRAGILGEIRVMETQIQRNRNELSINYKGIEDLYRTTAHLVVVSELKVEDLQAFNAALEKAIMKYHANKMAEINKIIQELWASTYYGADIHTIKIKSDTEKQSSRSFNYRVVMVKGDVELDMRGRCSAGQKVLASIIVRLALAEAFGTNCGVLALDEPTTNLDRDNIKSLAKSLVNIIKSRANQKNFQLVVITHDEEFTADLGRSEYSDYYWVVSKDNGKSSQIRRKNITDLF